MLESQAQGRITWLAGTVFGNADEKSRLPTESSAGRLAFEAQPGGVRDVLKRGPSHGRDRQSSRNISTWSD